jgi:LmbE family N-acetylglucosaminyl deacetylase
MRILMIAVHPDDETLGCGGTLLSHRECGDELHWLIMTAPDPSDLDPAVLEQKKIEVESAGKAYGMQSIYRLEFPATGLETVPFSKLLKGIRSVLGKVRPEIVYLIHHGDVHTDHQVGFAAVLSVLKPFYMSNYGVRRILAYETLSSTDAAPQFANSIFIPQIYRDISPFIDRKIEIMEIYKSETQPDPMPRGPSAIRALARFRGATIGVEHAEAFMLVREIC